MATTDAPKAIRYYQDGDVWRIVDGNGRRYYWETGAAFWAEERYARDAAIWHKHTAFTEREAMLLVDVLTREQKAIAVADDLAAGFHALTTACGRAREWRTRRNDQ